jgi:predicted nucleic acid-binding protein
MILLDSDVMIDILRNYPPAMEWFDALDENEEIALPGYVLMELIQGCRNRAEQDRLQRAVDPYGVAWPTPEHCNKALDAFTIYHLSHNAGMLDVLIGQTALAMGLPLHTFNQRHYRFIEGLTTIQPYKK